MIIQKDKTNKQLYNFLIKVKIGVCLQFLQGKIAA